jgi:aryl-alcohol dehydrogenase-like predicted oxidoreductase
MANDKHAVSRLVLGTAQLGMSYGIANKSGKPNFGTALSIIGSAYESGLTEFDTAQAYGESESVLGRIFQELGITKYVKVTTKLAPGLSPLNGSLLRRSVEESLEKLKIDQLEGFLLHREDMIDILDDDLADALRGLLQNGYVRNLGISVYSPKRARQALESDLFQVVHLPASIIDRRFSVAGIFSMAETLDKRIYIRSVFLQGLILMDSSDIPHELTSVKPVLEDLDRIAACYGLTRQAIALMYLRDRFEKTKVIFGVEVLEQVKHNMKCWRDETPPGLIEDLENVIPEMDGSILDPSRWFHRLEGGAGK